MDLDKAYAEQKKNISLGLAEEIPDWDWPEGDIDKYFDSLEKETTEKDEEQKKHEQ